MKLVIKDAGLIAAFTKVEGKDGVVLAKVLSSTDTSARLAALGGTPIELEVEGLTKGHVLTVGESVQFNADGTFAVEPSITAPATEKAEEVRKGTGGSSPAGSIAAVNRRLD